MDAGTFGTMGVGLGFAIAAALYCRDHEPESRVRRIGLSARSALNKCFHFAKVICVEGDSAFGFSGMEVETIVR